MNQIQAVEENALTYYKGIARLLDGRFIESDEVAWLVTGRRSLYRFNGVVRTVTRTENLSRVVDPILETFLAKGLPFFWVDWPSLGTPGLAEYLKARSIPLSSYSVPIMTREIDQLPAPSLPGEVEIIRVETLQEQTDWLNVFMEGFDEPEPSRPDFWKFLVNSLAEPKPVFVHFLARWQGKPCATSSLLCAQYSAGVYHVTTLPSHRGRGLGNALTLAAMQAAQIAGYATAILAATPLGYPIYRRLGFETFLTVNLLAWSGEG